MRQLTPYEKRTGKRAMNKRGIELAASFIIVLIISIVLFGLATALTYKIFCASSEKIDELDSSTERRVEQLLASGAAVNIPDASKTAKSTASFCGERTNAAASFLLGVRNDFNTDQLFTISCSYDGTVLPDDTIASPAPPFTTSCDDVWAWQNDIGPDVTIPARERHAGVILFNAPSQAEVGKHIFTIRVEYEGTDTLGNPATILYGAKKIYLTIE